MKPPLTNVSPGPLHVRMCAFCPPRPDYWTVEQAYRNAAAEPPEPGMFMVCADCGLFSVFGDNGAARKPTRTEIEAFFRADDATANVAVVTVGHRTQQACDQSALGIFDGLRAQLRRANRALNEGQRAEVDQAAAIVRDQARTFGVDLANPKELRAAIFGSVAHQAALIAFGIGEDEALSDPIKIVAVIGIVQSALGLLADG